MTPLRWAPLIALLLGPVTYAGSAVDSLLEEFRAAGAAGFDAGRGARLWTGTFNHNQPPGSRQCASCHTEDPRRAGKHARTGKPIGPLAPSLDNERLSDSAKIRKWLKRNCKWTLGRECTAQEKGDVLTYLRNL